MKIIINSVCVAKKLLNSMLQYLYRGKINTKEVKGSL